MHECPECKAECDCRNYDDHGGACQHCFVVAEIPLIDGQFMELPKHSLAYYYRDYKERSDGSA